MFASCTSFNQALSDWDVTNVERMTAMFEYARAFNQPLDQWRPSSCTHFTRMFHYATSFNQPIDSWVFPKAMYFHQMFLDAESFNQPLDGWNVSSATDMREMFQRAVSFNQDLQGWNVGSVTNMENMFREAISFNGAIASWNVSSVEDMSYMFYGATSFNQNLCEWGGLLSDDVARWLFYGTNCTRWDSPDHFIEPSGPYCYSCGEQVISPAINSTSIWNLTQDIEGECVLEEDCIASHYGIISDEEYASGQRCSFVNTVAGRLQVRSFQTAPRLDYLFILPPDGSEGIRLSGTVLADNETMFDLTTRIMWDTYVDAGTLLIWETGAHIRWEETRPESVGWTICLI